MLWPHNNLLEVQVSCPGTDEATTGVMILQIILSFGIVALAIYIAIKFKFGFWAIFATGCIVLTFGSIIGMNPTSTCR
jgi:hypothetical protein